MYVRTIYANEVSNNKQVKLYEWILHITHIFNVQSNSVLVPKFSVQNKVKDLSNWNISHNWNNWLGLSQNCINKEIKKVIVEL